MTAVIIDTSLWIDALRPGCEPALADLVKRLIRSDIVLLPGLIKAELLRGALSSLTSLVFSNDMSMK